MFRHYFTLLSWLNVRLERLSQLLSKKQKGHFRSKVHFFLYVFGYRTNAISKLMHSVSNLTGYSLVFLVSEM